MPKTADKEIVMPFKWPADERRELVRWMVYKKRRLRVDKLAKQMRRDFPKEKVDESFLVLVSTLEKKKIDWTKVDPHFDFIKGFDIWFRENYRENIKMMRSYRRAGGVNLKAEMDENKTVRNIIIMRQIIDNVDQLRRDSERRN